MRPNEPRYSDLLATAHSLADAAATAILPYFRQRLEIVNKAGGDGFDPVTAADRAAEQVIDAALRAAYPDHGMVGEEFGARQGASGYRWVIDPIDGTKAFILGLPVWGTLIGLLDGGKPLLGLMNQPFTRERFYADEAASFLQVGEAPREQLHTRACGALSAAMISTTHPDLFAAGQESEGFSRLKSATRMCRYGADCYAYCLLAAGHLDIVVEAGLKPHDIVALIPIIERAGGRITTWDGRPAVHGGRILACGDPALHAQAMAVLATSNAH